MELNATPSLWLQSGFVGLALILAGWWIWLFKRATYLSHLKQKTDSQAATRKSHKAFYITSVFLFLILSATAFISLQPWAHTFDSFPPPALRVFLVIVTISIVLALTPAGTLLIQNIPLYLLIGFQAFRIPVEILIHQAYVENITIVDMTYLGTNFDIISGISALLLALYVFRKSLTTAILLAWNTLGLALLINVVVTGIMSMPHPLQSIATDFPNNWITFFPFIWLPSILVCSALFGHLLIYRYVFHQKQAVVNLTAAKNEGEIC